MVTDSENTLAKERNDKDASKPVAIHFNLPNHSKQHMAVVGKDCIITKNVFFDVEGLVVFPVRSP